MPLSQRLTDGLRYPLRGGALAACVVLGLCHYAVLLPSVVGLFAALVVLDFHWMGVLVWHFRERLGMAPEAPEIATRLESSADEQLLVECEALAQQDPEEVAIRLRNRIRERYAPAVIHGRFRELLRRLRREDLLVRHGQGWIIQLCASSDERRALGVVQECREIDPRFLPDDPANTALLAKAAARIGMHELAWYLASGFVQRWPRHADAPALKLLAAPQRSNA